MTVGRELTLRLVEIPSGEKESVSALRLSLATPRCLAWSSDQPLSKQ
jgi:hypothetical protein